VAWRQPPIDAHNYWQAWDGGLYDKAWFHGAYIYSPVLAQLIWPFTMLPFEAFRLLLMAANVSALVYMVGWRAAGFVALLFPGVIGDLGVGSPHLLIGAAILAGVRGNPTGWAFLPLSKVTPGISWIWLIRDRHGLARAILFTGIVSGVSFLIAPQLWFDWGRLLIDATHQVPQSTDAMLTTAPLLLRLPLAVAIAVLATWRRWPWLLPVAAWLALPIMWGASTSILLACWPLWRTDARRRAACGASARWLPPRY